MKYGCYESDKIWLQFYSFKKKYNFLVHDLSNVLTILYLQNKDSKLILSLEKTRGILINSNLEKQRKVYLLGDVLKICVCKVGYRHNILMKNDFEIFVDITELECCLNCILRNFSKLGSNVIVNDGLLSIFLKKDVDLKTMEEIIKDSCDCNFLQVKKKLFLKW